jgi:phytoene dehydrogenase-like protein
MDDKVYDAAVIGAGFTGLATALELAVQGADVVLCEALAYSGGCASTFHREGRNYESGATLFSGFGEGQLFRKWIDRHGIGIVFEPLDPVLEFRDASQRLPLHRDRNSLVSHFLSMPDAPAKGIERFFSLQRRVSDLLWPLLDDPARLPPFSMEGGLWHLGRLLRYPQLLPLAGRSLGSLLDREGLGRFAPLTSYCSALCQITVQAGIGSAESPLALCALDYPFRGTGHVKGGIGQFAQGVLQAIRAEGGEVRLASRVRAVGPSDGGWSLDCRGGGIRARQVLSTLLPQDLSSLLPQGTRLGMGKTEEALKEGWGATMLYLVVEDSPALPSQAFHYQAVADGGLPMQEGNHVFCSLGGREEQEGRPGERVATVSSHVPIPKLRGMTPTEQAAYIDEVQGRMRRTLALRVPEVAERVLSSFTASPRTFQRFTRRSEGLVGGIPRRKGYHNYMSPLALQPLPGLWMAGDSHFPGQSILAASVGGVRAARAMLRSKLA